MLAESLFGFMEEPAASQYLRDKACYSAATADEISRMWREARARLGNPMPCGGHPRIDNLPAEAMDHIMSVMMTDGYKSLTEEGDTALKWIEIDPLIVIQADAVVDQCDLYAQQLGEAPDLQAQLHLCLPLDTPSPNFALRLDETGHAVTVHGDLSLRVIRVGGFGARPGHTDIIGAEIGYPWHAAQVFDIDGRCYLTDGHHRVLAMRRAGVTRIPCVLQSKRWEDLAQWNDFAPELLRSDHPPTMGHFASERSTTIEVRRLARVIHVSVADIMLPERHCTDARP